MNTTSRDMRILLAFNGNKRIPHLEEEIFANYKLTAEYLCTLCRGYAWYDVLDSNEGIIYYYALRVLQHRWNEAEPVIQSHKAYWEPYCRRFGIQTVKS